MRFKSIGIASAEQLQSMSMNQLKIRIKPTHISTCMEKILEDVFGMKYEQMCGLDCGIGRGYNVFTDTILSKTPYDLDDDATGKLGLPENVKVKHCDYFEIKCQEVEDQDQYITERLKSLNIEGGPNINFSKFSMKLRGGFNLRQQSEFSIRNSEGDTSFSIEQRLYKITLPDSISYTGEFIADVADLPQRYDENDASNIEKWTIFFSKWGYFVAMGMYLGGSISGHMQTKKKSGSDLKRDCKDAHAKLSVKLLSFQQKGLLDFDGESFDNVISGEQSSFTSSSLQWIGGECPKTLSFENIEKDDWDSWLESLQYKPAPLSTSLDLCPIYLLIDKIDKEKCVLMKKALEKKISRDSTQRPNIYASFLLNLFLPGAPIQDVIIMMNKLADDRRSIAQSNPSGGCFDGSSLVYLANGKQMKMKNISIGDKIISFDKYGNLVQDSIIAWLHKVPEGSFRFLKIDHSFGSLVITPKHILYLGVDRKAAFASSVKARDELSVFVKSNNGSLPVLSKVLSVTNIETKGLFAPLTLTGNLVVNGVAVSCYCKMKPLTLFGREIMSSQSISHLAFLPLRTAYMLGIDVNGQENDKPTGIHPYAKALMNLAKMG